ncbi:MAG: hypothetical protein O2954_02285 [bacterium]|nr:hypothetical protein [bacterium]
MFGKQWMIRVLVAGFLAAAGGGPAEADKMSTGDVKTDEVVVALQKKLAEAKACRARVITVFRLDGEEFEILDDLSVRVPGRMHVERLLAGEIRETIVSDGSLLWRYDPEEKMVSRINIARVYRATSIEVDADQPDPLRPFRAMEWKSIRYVEATVEGGENYRVFEAVPTMTLLYADLPVPPVRIRFSIHAGDGLLREIRFYGPEGNEILLQKFEEVVVNPTLDERLFEFVVPVGAHVMDVTDETIELLNETKEALKEDIGGAP